MEGEPSAGVNHQSDGPEDSHTTPDPTQPQVSTFPEAGPQPGLQLLAQRASEVADPTNGVTAPSVDGIFLDSPAHLTAHAPPTSAPQIGDGNFIDPTSTQADRTTSLAAIAGDTTTGSRDVDRYPDLIDEQFQDEHAPAWPAPPFSDALYGASQYPDESIAESEVQPIQAFAKLEFDDGEFYMTTYAIELGRDIEMARQALERDLEIRGGTEPKSRKRSDSEGGSAGSEKDKKDKSRSTVASVVSESGGVIADHHQSENGKKVKRKKSKSSSSSSQPPSYRSSMQHAGPTTDYNALAMASIMGHDSGLNCFGAETPMLPPPELTPLIPIHPAIMADDTTGTAPKSISRKHIRIQFNFKKNLFDVVILGRNGAFVDEEFYREGETQPLVNGSIIQIGGVGIRFVLPDVPAGETGAEMGLDLDSLSGGRLSFDTADSFEAESQEEEGEEEEGEEEGEEESEDNHDDMTNVRREEEEEHEMLRTRAKGKKKPEPLPAVPPKRKGPGRPPKNGISSKREQALLARQAREEAKVKGEGRSVFSSKDGKEKSGKGPKDVKEKESSVQPNGKRKYTKRKKAGGTEDSQAVRESTEHTDSVPPEQSYAVALPPKAAKEKKIKQPRSPSPIFDESTLTAEQLAKPSASYVVLIHEALTNSATQQMSLPQIYRAIERRYPFFKVRVQTQGWQSSVRHNLSQHPAFRKIERDGKGWMWGLVHEVSIEKEKKRRATPPPVSQQPYYPHVPPMMQHPYSYPGMPPANGHMPPVPYAMHPGMPPGRMPWPPPPPRPGFPLPLVNAQSESTYRSPYQPAPPPPATTQSSPQAPQPTNTNGVNGQYPTPLSLPRGPQSFSGRQTAGPYTSPSPHPPVPSAPLNNGNGEQDVNQAVSKFKTILIAAMEDKVRGDILVTSAVNRVLGLQNKSSLEGEEEDPNESTIMKRFSAMLEDLSKKNMEAKRQASYQIPEPTKTSPTAEGNNSKPAEGPTATSIAAEKAAKVVLTNGDASHPAVLDSEQANELNGSYKRSLENGSSESAAETGPPEAKRLASGRQRDDRDKVDDS